MSTSASNRLRTSLTAELARHVPAETWSGPERMAAAALRVHTLLGEPGPPKVDHADLARAVGRLAAGDDLSDGQLRLCCAGASTFVGEGDASRRVIDDGALTARLLALVSDARVKERQWRRCAYGLAHAVLLPDTAPAGAAGANADRLAASVVEYIDAAQAAARAEALPLVRDLFAHRSTAQFWPFLLDGQRAVLDPLYRLRVQPTSWVWKRIVADAIDDTRRWNDRRFDDAIDGMVSALVEQGPVLHFGLGAVLNRLASTTARRRHQTLETMTLDHWGSPLVQQNEPTWERWTDPEARAMVAGWLSRAVIRSFFERLGGAGADVRRSTFWARYADDADELWIFASRATYLNRKDEVKKLRALLGPRMRRLGEDEMNAFVLVLGGYAFVEFDTTGNALYVYAREDLPFELDRGSLTVGAMKAKERTTKWVPHQGAWERKVRRAVGELTGVWART